MLIGQKYRVSGAVGVSYKPNLQMLLLLSHTAQCKLWARTTLSGILKPLSWQAIGDQINGLCKALWVIQQAFGHVIECPMTPKVVCVTFVLGTNKNVYHSKTATHLVASEPILLSPSLRKGGVNLWLFADCNSIVCYWYPSRSHLFLYVHSSQPVPWHGSELPCSPSGAHLLL